LKKTISSALLHLCQRSFRGAGLAGAVAGGGRREKVTEPNLNTPPACAIYKDMETITKALIMEHAIFRAVFDQIERVLGGTKSAPEVQLLASVVEGLLRDHAETETNLAYSALDHALADRGALNRLYQDHHEIDDQFKRIHRTTDPAEAQTLLKKALAATREHFRREEKHVFPMLEKTLQPDTLGILGRKWMESHSIPATV
jgi:hemerythrin-like domain-containing protein